MVGLIITAARILALLLVVGVVPVTTGSIPCFFIIKITMRNGLFVAIFLRGTIVLSVTLAAAALCMTSD